MDFTLTIIISFVVIAISVVFFILKEDASYQQHKKSIPIAVEKRKLTNSSWNQFDDYFLKNGFKKADIEIIKNAIQEHSEVAKVMIDPKDDLFAGLKVDALSNDEDRIMRLIESQLKIGIYEFGELMDNDISTVIELFDFIKVKQTSEKSTEDKLFLK